MSSVVRAAPARSSGLVALVEGEGLAAGEVEHEEVVAALVDGQRGERGCYSGRGLRPRVVAKQATEMPPGHSRALSRAAVLQRPGPIIVVFQVASVARRQRSPPGPRGDGDIDVVSMQLGGNRTAVLVEKRAARRGMQ